MTQYQWDNYVKRLKTRIRVRDKEIRAHDAYIEKFKTRHLVSKKQLEISEIKHNVQVNEVLGVIEHDEDAPLRESHK